MTECNTCCPTGGPCPTVCPKTGATGPSGIIVKTEGQEDFLKSTSFGAIVMRGLKKLITEITSIKTLFLAFLCVAGWYDKISDTWIIVGGLATLGVREIPSTVFETIINKVGIK